MEKPWGSCQLSARWNGTPARDQGTRSNYLHFGQESYVSNGRLHARHVVVAHHDGRTIYSLSFNSIICMVALSADAMESRAVEDSIYRLLRGFIGIGRIRSLRHGARTRGG